MQNNTIKETKSLIFKYLKAICHDFVFSNGFLDMALKLWVTKENIGNLSFTKIKNTFIKIFTRKIK